MKFSFYLNRNCNYCHNLMPRIYLRPFNMIRLTFVQKQTDKRHWNYLLVILFKLLQSGDIYLFIHQDFIGSSKSLLPVHYQAITQTGTDLSWTHWGWDKMATIFQWIFLNENVWVLIKMSLIMGWHRPGDKPLSESMMVSLLTHICVTRPQWINWTSRYMFQWITKQK